MPRDVRRCSRSSGKYKIFSKIINVILFSYWIEIFDQLFAKHEHLLTKQNPWIYVDRIGRMMERFSEYPWISWIGTIWDLPLRFAHLPRTVILVMNLLQFPWSRNIFARHVASRILWRSGFTGSNPILVLLLQKFKKVAQKVIKKRVPFVSNTRG